MATYTFDKIDYGGNTYVVSDSGALQLTGGQVTGPVTFGDSVSIDEATLGDLVVNGSASFTNRINADTYNGGHPTYFIKGTQTAATNVWTGTLPDGVTYYNGLTIDYLLPYAGNSSAATLNLSGLGAKPVYYGNSATGGTTTHYGANTVIHLTYVIDSAFNSGNGCWKASNYYDSNTVDRLRNSYFRPYAGEAIYRYKFVMQGADNRVYPIVITDQTNATQVAKVPTQVGLRPGRIWYYNTTGTVAAGAVVGANSLDSAYQTTIAVYNFNTDIAAYRMLYLRGTYNKTTDLFTLYKDSSSPCTSYYTQVPTNTANITLSSYFTSGYYYMLLGGTYSSINYISLFEYNPLYYFDGTNLIPVSTKVAQDTNTTYSAGTGISLSGTTFSAKLGYTTSGNNRAVQADLNGNLYVTQKDDNTNTTYALSNALSSHKFTETLTAGGSGSGTSTATMEFVAGTGITLTDDTTNKKITIACNVTNTDTKVSTAAVTSGTLYYPVVGADTTSAATKFYDKTGITYNGTNGTTSAVGSAILTLGNSTASGTVNNKQGQLVLYGSTAYKHTIQGAPTANQILTLPNVTGTLAVAATTTLTLSTTWNSNIQTVSVSGVTAQNTVIVTPTPTSYDTYCECGIYCSAQTSGTLEFKCDEVPSTSLTVNVLIIN